MGVLDTLSRLLVCDEVTAPRDATTALVQSYMECVTRAAQLERHAHMAPQHCSVQALERLAEAEAEQCARLRDAIEIAGAPPPPVTAEPSPRGALNHWGRLVQDLEAHRRSVLQYREFALRLTAHLPQTAALFESLCRAEAMHCEELRALIARADPQALD
jgi:hypothetical protein